MELAVASQYEYVNNTKLQDYAEINAYESNKVLSNLVNKKFLLSTGSGRGMKYVVNSSPTTYDNMGCNEENIEKLVAVTMQKQRLEPSVMKKLILELCKIEPLSAKELGKYLNRDYSWIKKEYISMLVKENKLKLLYPDKPRSPKQKYYTK